jgi:1-acyl-sn-glycerol-3-phosphate acyltransferase
MQNIITKIRHYIKLLLYISAFVVYSTNICFVLYILKKVKYFKYICTTILNYILITFQSVIKFSTIIGGTNVIIYKKKNKKLSFTNNMTILPNHISEMDSLFIGMLYCNIFPNDYKVVSFAKSTIRFYPFIGWMGLIYDTIFVQNKNKQPNLQQHVYIKNKLILENNNNFKKHILIFIEGTVFTKTIKKYRELFNEEINYKNLLIPKTNGIYMINENIDIDGEIYVCIKFENIEKEDYTIFDLLKGINPSNVHMFIDTELCYKNTILLNNREKYNKNIYNKFKQIDNILDKDYVQWKTKYDSVNLNINIFDILYTLIVLYIGKYTLYGLLYNWIYRGYFISVICVYILYGFIDQF